MIKNDIFGKSEWRWVILQKDKSLDGQFAQVFRANKAVNIFNPANIQIPGLKKRKHIKFEDNEGAELKMDDGPLLDLIDKNQKEFEQNYDKYIKQRKLINFLIQSEEGELVYSVDFIG